MLIFKEQTHQYFYNDLEVPSVTTIIHEFNPFNFSGEAVKVAAEFGTAFHYTVKLYEEGQLGEYDNLLVPYLNQWKKFRTDFPEYVHTQNKFIEVPLYSKRYNYAGTPDILFYNTKNKSLILIDIKTGAYTASWDIQTAAYEWLIRENLFGGKSIPSIKRLTVTILPDKYVLKSYSKKSDFIYFQSMLNVYGWKVQNKLIKGGHDV